MVFVSGEDRLLQSAGGPAAGLDGEAEVGTELDPRTACLGGQANKKGARRRPFGEYEQEVLSAATAAGGVATESEAGKAQERVGRGLGDKIEVYAARIILRIGTKIRQR
jgi:hypothetical protein